MTAVAAISVALFAARAYQPAQAEVVPLPSAAQLAVMEARAFATASTPEGLTAPEAIPVQIRRNETFEQAVRRAGVTAEDASAVAATLSNAVDVSAMRAGQKFETAVSRPRGGRGDARLIGLTMRTGPATQVTVSRSFDGALRLRALEEQVINETVVLTGKVERSLSATARREGVPAEVARVAGRLFSSKLDMRRDVNSDDQFTYVYGRTVTDAGRTIGAEGLLYAQLKDVVFYRFQPAGSREVQYFDATGKNIRQAAMAAPLRSGYRISSSYGFRRHPIAGSRRMHQGTDMAAPSGTPVVAPADGVVVEARRWGGYGNWLRIRHANGLETGYGHLSRYGSGIRAGQRVRQGQVVAYVGSTGASTGPHLHYEMWRSGQRINPSSVRVDQGVILTGADLTAFRAEKARIDRIRAAGGERRPQVQRAALRPADTQG
jgi:murein DD-endopeptidase MepM/ murein hydrolase activator NlpD